MADEIVIADGKEPSLFDQLDSETVKKLLECPVCLELPLPPIYVCNKGHIVCNNCQARTYACPLCREHYSTTRGFVAEGIIEKCTLRCKHADQGCPLSMRGSEMVDHLEVCDYRPVKCVDCAGKLINFEEYEDHLLKHHRINGINQNRAYVIYSMNLAHQISFGEKCCWPQYYLKAFDNATFLLRLYATHWFVCAWVSLLGPKSDCAKYEALLEFHPTNDDTVVHTWQGPVNHFRADPAKDIFLQGRGLITPMETLMQMAPVANDHAEWLYNIEILQVSEKSESEETIFQDESSTESPAEVTSAPPVQPGEKSARDVSICPTEGNETSQHPASNKVDIIMKQSRLPKSPARIVCEAPQNPPAAGVQFRTPRRVTERNAHFSNSNPLTPGPATLSPSTSVLAAAATITSVVPTPNSLLDSVQNASSAAAGASSPYSVHQSFGGNDSTQGPVTVSTIRHSARLLNSLRRSASPLTFLFRGENRRFSINEDDWDVSSDTDEE